MEDKPVSFVDCSGLLCPLPVVKAKRALKGIEVGQVIEMISTDPGVVPDMQAWEKQTRHEVFLVEEQEKGKYRFLIRKTH